MRSCMKPGCDKEAVTVQHLTCIDKDHCLEHSNEQERQHIMSERQSLLVGDFRRPVGSTIAFAGGKATSSKIPRFDLIPREALVRLADRFKAGIERHKEKAWNALSDNQECLQDVDMILARVGHVIDHATKLRDMLVQCGAVKSGSLGSTEFIGDDDAAAILWGGAFLVCACPVAKSIVKTPTNVIDVEEDND